MKNNEPKPCPFCGGEVIPPDWEDGDILYYIEHRKGCFLLREGVKVISTYDIEAWNTRAEEPERTCGLRSRLTGLYCYECSVCGTGLHPDCVYCPECGARVVMNEG